MSSHQADGPSQDQPADPPTVTIGITTYRRPASLVRTLHSIGSSLAAGPPTGPGGHGGTAPWSLSEIVVVDNDTEPSARNAIAELAADGYAHPVRYVHEPERGLAAARNRALLEATSDVLVFVDDDEEVGPQWPHGLLRVMGSTGAALVGGPVRTAFDHEPASWVRSSGLFDRDDHADGAQLSWLRSGNLALDLTQINDHSLRFDPAYSFSGGEDVAFTREARRAGLDLRWAADAEVTETVGAERTTIGWVTRRERSSTANWVRVELAESPGGKGRAVVAARGVARLVQGVATIAAGLVSLHSGRAVNGLVLASRGIGAFVGLINRIPRTYGNEAVTS